MSNCLSNEYVFDESTWSNFKEVILTMFSSDKLCISMYQARVFFCWFEEYLHVGCTMMNVICFLFYLVHPDLKLEVGYNSFLRVRVRLHGRAITNNALVTT